MKICEKEIKWVKMWIYGQKGFMLEGAIFERKILIIEGKNNQYYKAMKKF